MEDPYFLYQFWAGNRVFNTELLDSPLLEGKNIAVKEFSYIYLGVVNYYDLIISKLFRSADVDIEDCLDLIKTKKEEIDMRYLEDRFRKTASYDVSEDKVNKNFDVFLEIAQKEGLINEK